MSRVCSICGKGRMTGHTVSYSKKKYNRVWEANVQKVKLEVDGATKSEYVCTKCLKTAKAAAAEAKQAVKPAIVKVEASPVEASK